MSYQRFWRIGAACAVLTLLLTSSSYAASPSGSNQPPTPPAARPAVAEPPAWQNVYPEYKAIKMVSATNGWIVGQNGIIKHLYNGGWGDYLSPVTSTLRAVDAVPGEGWAVGENNTIIQLVGTDWQTVASPAPYTTTLTDVKIVSSGEAWAIGNYITYVEPYTGDEYCSSNYLMHYSGGVWSLVPTPKTPSCTFLAQMSWTSPSDGWIVGAIGSDQAVAYHYVAGEWTSYILPTSGYLEHPRAISVFMRSANEGWAGISGEYDPNNVTYHWNGTDWQQVAAASTTPASRPSKRQPASGGYFARNRIYSLLSFAANDYYSAGESSQSCIPCNPEDNFSYTFLAHNGTYLSADYNIRYISGVAANDIWGIGPGGAIYHWNGSSMSVSGASVVGTQVQMLAQNDGWLNYGTYGEGGLYHYDGSAWTPNLSGRVTAFNFASSKRGWAADQQYSGGGQINFRPYDGSGWGSGQLLPGYAYAMQVFSPTGGWAVGENNSGNPTAYQLSGNTWSWQVLDSGRSGILTGISFASPSEGWAIGATTNFTNSTYLPLVYRYDGSNWNYYTLPMTDFIPSSVYARASNDVWLGGSLTGFLNQGRIIHWDGSTWTVMVVPTTVYSLQMLSADEGWAGAYGMVLHYSGGIWQPAYTTSSSDYYRLSFSSPTDGWAVGGFNTLHYYPACYDYYYDVPAGYFAATAVFYLSCKGIVNGTGNHMFSPNSPASRDQFAKMITLARGWALTTPTQPTFSDVPTAYPFYSYIETAYANGAIRGASAAQCQARGLSPPCFLPHDQITRAQTAIITQQAFAWPSDTTGGPHFSDVAPNFYAYSAIETCYNHGVVSGIGGGLFAPNANVTRAQIAVILYRALTNP